MIKSLVIYDSDSSYAIRLMEYIKRRDLGFQVLVFTEEESFKKAIMHNSIEILLVGETIPLEENLKDKACHLFILSEQPLKSEDTKEWTIFKYQSAENIIAEIISQYTMKKNETGKTSALTTSKVISLVGIPSNRNKYYFAFSYAYLLSEKKKVLFIPLDLLPIPLLSTMDVSNQKLSEFIYYLKDNDSDLIAKMNQYRNCLDRLSYLAGLSHGFDLLSIAMEDMGRWINELKTSSGYDFIVFYLGSFAEYSAEAIRKSDKVLMMLSDSLDDEAVIKEMERQLNLIGISIDTGKIQRLMIPELKWNKERIPSLQDLKTLKTWFAAMQYVDRLQDGGEYGESKREASTDCITGNRS